MEMSAIVATLQESLFVILVFLGFLTYALVKGQQGLINIIMGLYFGLLISLEFPYYSTFTSSTSSPQSQAMLMTAVFIAFAVASTMLFGRLMPREYDEKMFESFGKKFLFALSATVLVMAYSYHALPITELVDPGTPMQYLFGAESSFFWWLLAPLVILFFL